MGLLPILTYPDPVLRKECQPVESFDQELRRLAADMVETMHAAPGVGLAASQPVLRPPVLRVGRPARRREPCLARPARC